MNSACTACLRTACAVLLVVVGGCSFEEPPWTGRDEPVERNRVAAITLAPGVAATLGWSRGALLERIEMQPGAVYPEQRLDEELIIVGQGGSATIEIGGHTAQLTNDHVVYLQPGTVRSMKAGPKGWKAVEVYSPVRLDHLKSAGQNTSGLKPTSSDRGVTPSLQPGVVVNLNEIQWTPLTDPAGGKPYRRSSTLSRLIWGKNAQISVARLDPGSDMPRHLSREDPLTLTIRGALAHDRAGDTGADVLDVFWPVRADYVERARRQQALYEQIVPPGARPQKLAEGFTFTEGPTWLKGRLYFSDMFFQNPAGNDWTGSPARSRLIVMESGGTWRVLSSGMQSNGTLAAKNGNLLVCDMFGHRVVEVNPATGTIVRVVLDTVNGKPIDGPNDLVMDAKGGLYITDPQFTPEARKSQPGKQVYYVASDGQARVVIGPGEYAMPNGVELSPDGKTLYVNNTWAQPGEHFVWAYDVAGDGSLSNKRRFAMLNLRPDVLAAANPADRFDSRADGTTIDTDGRYYVATNTGVQIFLPDGTYAGTIWMPQDPVSVTFGGASNDVLYIVGHSSVWRIQTKVRGFRHPPGMN